MRRAAREPAPYSTAIRLTARAQIRRRQPATLIAFEIEAHSLPFAWRADTGALKSADMQEHILAAIVRLDKPEALGGVEPFYRSRRRRSFPWRSRLRRLSDASACRGFGRAAIFGIPVLPGR